MTNNSRPLDDAELDAVQGGTTKSDRNGIVAHRQGGQAGSSPAFVQQSGTGESLLSLEDLEDI
ncbi:MAG: hypothetical protein AAF479_02290 [Pseudomonadota bacterium]